MLRKSVFARSIVVYAIVLSFLPFSASVRANDIVPSDDLVSGASVFVFRGSSKKPQSKLGAVHGFRGGAGGRAKIATQIASARQRKADAAKARAAEVARLRARERVLKLKQSNTFAAKGEAAMESGDVNGAITSFRQSIRLNPKNAEGKAGLSEALTAKGIEAAGSANSEAGLEFLNEAVQVDPKNAAAYAKIGEIYDAKGDNAKAIANYDKAVTIDPEFTAVYLPLGMAHAEAKNYVEAEAYLAKAEAAGIASNEARLARADIFAKQNRTQEAVDMLDKVIAAEPTNAAAIFQKASILDRAGKSDEAIAGYQKAVQVDPNYAAAWYELGVIAYNKGDYNGALTAYQNVVRIEPTNYTAQANLASTYRQLGQFGEANAAYKAAEPGYTKSADHYSEWGFCLGKTNEWDKAVARLLTARDLDPTAVDNTNLGWAYYNAAKIDKKNGDEEAAKAKFELAKTYLNTAVQQDPNLDAAYMNLGSTNNELGNHEDAAQALKKANELHPGWTIALNQLGLSYRGMNNLSLALQAFNAAVDADGNYVNGLFNLGSTQNAAGDKKGAKKTQDRLKKLDSQLAMTLGNIIAGKLIEAGTNEIKKKVRIPGIPFPFRD
jgi:tetratricopeptide (TPR) repeat protein